MGEQISQLLVLWSEGDSSALDRLMPMVYDELRKLGLAYLRRRPQDDMLQPTMLVHEAWIKLAGKQTLSLQHRSQFYALAAKVMRDTLVDYFRRQQASKRGGSCMEVQLESAQDASAAPRVTDLIMLDEALNHLAEIKPRYAQLVELKFFAGLTIDECAGVMHVSSATVEREWNFARVWLRRELGG